MTVRGEVVRMMSTPLGTPGRLRMDNGFECDTLELPWHNNERGRSCTMADTYFGRVYVSPRLGRPVIRFQDKNGREDCEIHNGNFAADTVDLDGDGTPEQTQVHGCTEVGHGYGMIQRKDGRLQWGLMNSTQALVALILSLTDEFQKDGYHDVIITYKWADGCSPQS
jgi:hypothetical protein